MNVFVSMPMRGLNDEEIARRFDLAKDYIWFRGFFVRDDDEAERISKKDINIFNTNYVDSPEDIEVNKGLYYLGRSLMELSTADVAVFWPGWEGYRGCKIEHEACEFYGVDILYLPSSFTNRITWR